MSEVRGGSGGYGVARFHRIELQIFDLEIGLEDEHGGVHHVFNLVPEPTPKLIFQNFIFITCFRLFYLGLCCHWGFYEVSATWCFNDFQS